MQCSLINFLLALEDQIHRLAPHPERMKQNMRLAIRDKEKSQGLA